MNDKLLDDPAHWLFADDEHPFGGIWTRIKLDALGKYLGAFNTVLKNQNFSRLYIDAFAGTGRCDIKVNGQTTSIDGSARRALAAEPEFHRYIFIERQAKNVDALRGLVHEHPNRPIEIIQDDANDALRALCARYGWRDERAVLFLDPYGLQVEWQTLASIARTKAIDVWYLFPLSGLYRQAARNADAIDAGKATALTRLLGTEDWRQVFYAPKRQTSFDFVEAGGDERSIDHKGMLDFVSTLLKDIFPAVLPPKVLYQGGDSRNPVGAPLFALYFAVSNPAQNALGRATKIADHILKSL